MTGVLDDPALYRFTGGEPPALDALRRRYAAQVAGLSPDGSERWLNWIVRLGDPDTGATGQAGTPIGFVQATVVLDGRRADVAWVIGVPWQGAGYAAEAAAALVAWLLASGVVDVSAHVHPDHEASGRVAARAGLIPTGTIEDGEQLWRLPAEPPPA